MPNREINRSRRRQFGVLIVAAMALSGCYAASDTGSNVWRDDLQTTAERQVRLNVTEQTYVIRAAGWRLAAGEAGRVGAFLSSQGAPWGLDVQVRPLTSAGQAALGDLQTLLVDLGVQPHRITLASEGRAAGDGDIAIVARRLQANAVGCPDHRRSNLIDLAHMNSSNFGCATSENLARMVADPRELSTGRALAPDSGTRATAAVERYRTDKVKALIGRDGGGSGGGGGDS